MQFHWSDDAAALMVQVTPSGEVMTRFMEGEPAVFETATYTPLPYATALQPIKDTATEVQVIPSADVMTRPEATATNKPLPYVTLDQAYCSTDCKVHVMPFVEVMTMLVPPLEL